MPDPFDEASDIEIAERDEAIMRTRKLTAPETHPDFDYQHCIECGEEIPKPRLILGKIRCVDCQRQLEVEASRRG